MKQKAFLGNIYGLFLRSLSTATFKQSTISFSGTFITGILGVIYYAIMARVLGPESYGIFSVSLTTLALVASIANVGTDTGIIRFVSAHLRDDKPKALRFMKLGLEVKIFVSLILIFVGWPLIPIISTLVFHKPELITPLRISLIGVSGTLLSSFGTSSLQAVSKFFLWSFFNVFSNALRLVLTGLLLMVGMLTIYTGLVAYSVVLFVVFISILFFIPAFWKAKDERSVAKVFFHYNLWIASFTVLSAMSSRIDTYITTRVLSLAAVGIYSVGVSLSSFVSQIVLAIGSVVAPKLAAMKDKHELLVFLKKLQLFVIVLAVLGTIVGIPIGAFMIPRVYGEAFRASISPFSILLIAQALFLISVPVHTTIIYYFSYPKIFLLVTIVNLFIILILGTILTNLFGYNGAAVAVLIGNISNLIIPTIWLFRRFNKHK